MSEQEVSERTDGLVVERIEGQVDWPPGNVAAYLIDCREPILIDAIMTGEDGREELAAGLAERDLAIADIEHLVITHPHVDHVGQVPAIVEEADPTVYAPEGIAERFDRDPDDLAATVERNATEAGLRGEYLERAVDMSVESLERDSRLLSAERVDHWVPRGGEIEVGPVTFETTHTPGHQADHLVYRTDVDGESVLFAGDMALDTFRPVAMHVGFDDGYEGAIGAYYGALDRLGDLDVDRVFTGHDPAHTDLQGAVTDDRESLDRLMEKTLDLLEPDNGKTAVDVAFERSGERDMRYLVIETMSALAKLEADGEATSTTEDGVRQFRLA
jgi:glyoxylase-like metal-dependent hydrolase (beta-lactamase superfamily II)